MGIALFTLDRLLAPLQGLARWIALGSQHSAARTPPHAVLRNTLAPIQKPLRVVRVVDSCSGPSSAGRMVISGRMADVCAELDRLVALEAAHC